MNKTIHHGVAFDWPFIAAVFETVVQLVVTIRRPDFDWGTTYSTL